MLSAGHSIAQIGGSLAQIDACLVLIVHDASLLVAIVIAPAVVAVRALIVFELVALGDLRAALFVGALLLDVGTGNIGAQALLRLEALLSLDFAAGLQ